MKKALKSALKTLIFMAVLTGVGIYFLMKGNGGADSLPERMKKEQSDLSKDSAYRYALDEDCVVLKTTGDNKNVLNFNQKNVYSVETSNQARARLDRLIKRMDAEFDKPIIAMNPFGTNPNSLYFYFKLPNRAMLRYTITDTDEKTPDFVRYVNCGKERNLSEVQEFSLSGIIPGRINYIILETLDSTGAQREKKIYKYDAPATKATLQLKMDKGNSREESVNGLYMVMPSGDTNIYTYDNQGMLRNITVTESSHGSRFYQSGDEVLYQVAANKVAKVSALGRVTGVVKIGGVNTIKDFSYDAFENIYSLATVKGKDCLLATSFKTGKTKTVYEFKKGLVTQSLSTPNAGSVMITMASPSGIVKLDAIASIRTNISYILGKQDAWTKFGFKKKKISEDKTSTRWNTANSYLVSDSAKDSFSIYVNDQGTGTALYFRLDDKKKETSVGDTFPVAYKGKGFCERDGEHYIIGDGAGGTYAEYDKKGRITTKYMYGKALDGVTKMTLDKMCFYGAS